MTHFAGRAGKVLFLSVLTAMLLAGHRPGSGHRHRRRLHHRFFPAAAGRALYLRLRGHHAGQECGGGDLG